MRLDTLSIGCNGRHWEFDTQIDLQNDMDLTRSLCPIARMPNSAVASKSPRRVGTPAKADKMETSGPSGPVALWPLAPAPAGAARKCRRKIVFCVQICPLGDVMLKRM